MCNTCFSHDSNARNSKKLLRLRNKMGAEGYGIYFMLLERLREEDGYCSDFDPEMLAFDLRVEADKIRQVITDYGLFVIDKENDKFWSAGFDERMTGDIEDSDTSSKLSSRAKKAAAARWNKNSENPQYNACNATSDACDANEIKHDAKNAKHMLSIKDAFQASYGTFEENLGQDKPSPDANSTEIEKKEKEVIKKSTKRNYARKIKENFSSSSVPSSEEKSEEEKQKDILIRSTFFFRNWRGIDAEVRRFKAFNNLNGRSWQNMTREELASALELWKQDPPTPPRVDALFLTFWLNIYAKLPDDPVILREFLCEKLNVSYHDNSMLLNCTPAIEQYIERNLDKFESEFRKFMFSQGVKNLNYKIIDS